jgi:NADPH-dependent 2,4-dienoyl-CoA reductase/sulfur reductase-like enzyme/pSer/pThr/pTyr-binding forkhead associated (FHA) protein
MAEHYVIIGNGIAGVTASEVLRSEQAEAQISVITNEPFPPYYRPALKDYLAGRVHEDKLWSRPVGFYQEQQIRLFVGRAMKIQAGQHLVQLDDGQEVPYSRLLIACGASPRRLSCPGANLAGVTTLRSIADYQELQKRLVQTRRILVIGSGTLALETVETLRHRGHAVTHLLRKRILWSEVLDPTASDLILQQERRDGVDVRREEEVTEIIGEDGRVSGVVTTSGAHIACEMVVMAIGVEPNLDLLKRSGIPCGRGVQVDRAMRTSVPDIYAAGDVLEIIHRMTGRTRILGQWYPAIQQARAAAYSMLDILDINQPVLDGLFYNATSLYGLELAAAGLTQFLQNKSSYQEIIAEPKPRVYRKVVLKNGIAVGVLMLGNRQGALALKRAIDYSVNLQPVVQDLFAEDFDLNAWLDQQGVPPVRLNVHKRETTKRAIPAEITMVQERKDQFVQPTEAWLMAVTGAPTSAAATGRIRLSPTRVMTVGRQEGVYLLIDHISVSRRHAEISYNNGWYMLRDLGSSNGTFLNNIRLEKNKAYNLKSGDEVLFGKVIYQFQRKVEKSEITYKNLETGMYTTQMHEMATGFYSPTAVAPVPAVSYQPVLNARGELFLPGAQRSVPAEVVATFGANPVLIAVQRGIPVVLPLRRGKSFTLGRGKTSDLVLTDMAASRRHAEIIPKVDGLYIRDLDSSNGITVNQVTLDNPYRLTHGDRIQIGSVLIYFVQLHAATMPAQPVIAGQLERICYICGTFNLLAARSCTNCSASLEKPVVAFSLEKKTYAGK